MHLANAPFAALFFAVSLVLTGLTVFSMVRKRLIIRALLSQGQQGRLLSGQNPLVSAVRTSALLLALYLAAFSALDPRWGTKSVLNPVEGIDVVFVMDISRSMLSPQGGRPASSQDRLTAAKKLSAQLMSLLTGSRIGLTAFAGFAFNVIPLTADTAAASVFLNELSTDMIDVQGTNLEDAIRKALDLFEKDALTHRAVVIFTDGEDTEFDPVRQARSAREKGIPVFTVGMGSPEGGWIPLTDAGGRTVDYLKKNGELVTSRPNPALLDRIAAETRGLSVRGDEGSIVELARRLDTIRKTRFGSNPYEFMEPQFQVFLGLAVVLLLLSVLLPERGLKKNAFRSVGPVLLLSIFASAALPARAQASDASRGVGEYRKENYDEALRLFRKATVHDPKNEKLRFNEGVSLFRLGRLDESLATFAVMTNSGNRKVRERSLYNFGLTAQAKGNKTAAAEAYRRLLESLRENSPLYDKTLRNFLALKKQPPPRNDGAGQDRDRDSTAENDQDRNGPQPGTREMKSLSPTEVENVLSLIEEEEKKHLARKEKGRAVRFYPKNDW